MKVILKKDVRGLGRFGQVVETSDGYARNFLLPQGIAAVATAKAAEEISRVVENKESTEQKIKNEIERVAAKLRGKTFAFNLPADIKGHLYAGLKESEILAKIRESAESLPRSAKLVDYVPIKNASDHECKLSLGGNTSVPITVKINKI